jgi:hypothetical protein
MVMIVIILPLYFAKYMLMLLYTSEGIDQLSGATLDTCQVPFHCRVTTFPEYQVNLP